MIKEWKKTRKTNSVWNSYISPFGRPPGVKGEKRTRVGLVQVRNKLSGMTKFRGRFSLGSGTRLPLSILGLDPLHLFLLLLLRRLDLNVRPFSPICSHGGEPMYPRLPKIEVPR